jgi:hypothetical protein
MKTGTPTNLVRRPYRHRHRWGPWFKAGMFDSTMRRDCLAKKCNHIQTRRPTAGQ